MEALPNLIIIGAMKCGTTALHRLLAAHPDVAMAGAKELNFFFGPPEPPGSWHTGNWHRGPEWYARQFDPRARVRGEASPGYTSPSHPEAAGRMAALVPDARLVYLVRDPVDRAVSQYRHHVRDGTEHRPLLAALSDPDSQYLARSRYFERLAPFLAHYPPARIAVIAQEHLRDRPRTTLRDLLAFLGLDPEPGLVDVAVRPAPPEVATDHPVPLARDARDALAAGFAADLQQLRALPGARLRDWLT